MREWAGGISVRMRHLEKDKTNVTCDKVTKDVNGTSWHTVKSTLHVVTCLTQVDSHTGREKTWINRHKEESEDECPSYIYYLTQIVIEKGVMKGWSVSVAIKYEERYTPVT